MLIHAWMYCSYYDRLLIMGDDMFIIAYEQAVIMHDQRHIHVIMNIILYPFNFQACHKSQYWPGPSVTGPRRKRSQY